MAIKPPSNPPAGISPEAITGLAEKRKANPFLNFAKSAVPYLPEVLAGGSFLLDTFSKNPYEDVVNQAFQGIIDQRSEKLRQSQGEWTPKEIQEIRSSRAVAGIASNVAQRGFGTSPAGVQQISDAQQQAFLGAQATATRMLPALNQQIFQIGQEFIGDSSFTQDLGDVIQGIVELRGLRKLYNPTGDGEDVDGNDFDGVTGNALLKMKELIDMLTGEDSDESSSSKESTSK